MTAVTDNSMFLIVGLGNPGPKYADTRHNIGFGVVDELAGRATPMPASFSVHKRSNAEIAETRLGPAKVVLAKPRTFMNLSGGPVKALADFFKIPPAQIIVIHDDLDLDFTAVKLRPGGGDRGHNGLRSTTKSLGTKDYQRLSVGIGRPPGRMDPADFVLRPFARSEQADLPIIYADAADLIDTVIGSGRR
ncbi:Peptidyl-tRNA hydrolase [Corynebacterium occultum]|uniref:Peptidyl-tRNA hydrolase n=1 Tax=Corynebacterium occultum TaxID=2675219 RepID=A0A6B8W2X6_9CORY|nr:aminoacyl-tRNA hydrolase [Corynebacterium occultum]QGU06821.1 Peptidyl-tRNA hydrolase [Corynebacterium occultum]